MHKMKRIEIGESGLEIAPFTLGGNVFGWTVDQKKSFEILDAYRAAGFNFIDTADSYSHWANAGIGGQSETIIGNWLKSRGVREQIILATKVGSGAGKKAPDSSRRHILQAIDQSLKRLQTDYIDLYYTHYDDGHTPVEETLSAYQELMKVGKIRAIAVSNITPNRLIESLAASAINHLPKYQALQPLYNLMERRPYENDFAPIASTYALTVFPYYALASGFLTGKYRSEADFSKSVRGRDITKYMHQKGQQVLEALDHIAQKHHTVPASVALAWFYAQPNIGAPIASATSTTQLEQILAGAHLQLDASDLAQLNRASAEK